MDMGLFEVETPDVELFQKRGAGDEKLVVLFHMGVQKDEKASAEAGRQVFKDVEFVRIFLPGDRNNIVERPVTDEDRIRFKSRYDKFKETNDSEVGSGTPLAEWPIITRSMAEELRYLGFRTVEHIANVDDSQCESVPYLRKLSARAKAYIQVAKGDTAPIETLHNEIDTLKSQNNVLADAVKKLGAELEALRLANQQ